MKPSFRAGDELTAEFVEADGLKNIVAPWRELAEARSNAFISPEWALAFAVAARDEVEPLTVVVRDSGDGVRGVLPLVRARRGGRIAFAGADVGDFFHPACAEGDEDAVAAAAAIAIGGGRRRTRITLRHVPVGSNWPRCLAAGVGGAPIRMMGSSVLPYANLAGLDWDGYLAGRSKSFRKRVRYLERALKRDHHVAVREASNRKEVDELLEAFFSLHDLRWAAASSLSAEVQREFLRGFAARAMDRGWLRLRVLELDGSAAAAFYGWRIGSRFCFYQSGLDTNASRHSLGTASVAMAARAAIEEGAETFELLRGDEPYKLRFADSEREARTLAVAGSGPDRALSWGEARLRRLRRRILNRGREKPA